MENFDTCNGVIHVVEKGDTLYKLSKLYKCNLCDIITANPYVNVYNMQVGEEICIPVQPQEPENMSYVVKEGDTFEDVFRYFGVGPKELFENNKGLNQAHASGRTGAFYKRKDGIAEILENLHD